MDGWTKFMSNILTNSFYRVLSMKTKMTTNNVFLTLKTTANLIVSPQIHGHKVQENIKTAKTHLVDAVCKRQKLHRYKLLQVKIFTEKLF